MLKNIAKLEVIIENKIYHLLCDNDSPTHHIKEALFQFGKYIGQVEDAVKKMQEDEQEKLKVEQPKESEPILEQVK